VNRIPTIQSRHITNSKPDDYAELEGEPNIDTRADGGFINPGNARARDRRMRWDAAADRQLLIFGFGREIRTEEYKILAERFEQKPTVKAIQERITKLRVEVRRVLKETGIFDPERVAQPPPPRGPATPGQGMSSPAQPSAKKAKKDRPASGGPKPKGNIFPPGTGSPAPRPQPELPSAQPPSATPPAGPVWGAPYPPGAPVATMLPPYGAIPPSVFSDPRMGPYQQQRPPLPTFTGEAFTPSLPSQLPSGVGTDPPGEEEDPMVRSERELKEKRAKREAVSDTYPLW
jgi:hypothetical protein